MRTVKATLTWLGSEQTLTEVGTYETGFPSFNIMPNGTYIATFKAKATGGNLQAGNGVIRMRQSTDKGATWGASTLLMGDAEVHNYDAAELVVMPNGQVWAISSKVAMHKLVYKTSADNGATWSAEADFPAVMPAGGYQYALDNHFARSGNRIFLTIYCRDNADTVIIPGLLYTDDSGANWNFAFLNGPLGLAGQEGSEASVIPLGGNNMLCIFRWITLIQADNVAQSVSTDLGATWSAPVDIGKSNGGIFPFLADVELTRIDANTIVLTALTNDSATPTTQGLMGWVSTDNGVSWGPQQVLINEMVGEIGYHGIELEELGSLFVVYDNQVVPNPPYRVRCRRILLSDWRSDSGLV